ncbi:MAG: hypothetical protein ACR2NL_00875, partial [Acidimicrobiia bacterium]
GCPGRRLSRTGGQEATMISIVLAITGCAAILTLGLALTASRFGTDGSNVGPAEVLDGAGIALPGLMLVSLVAIRAGVFDRSALIVIGVVALISVDPRLARGALPTGGWTWIIAVIAAVGLWLRRDPVYFLGDWSDFGEYVNRGNAIADGGTPGGFFPPLTETYMALGHLVFSQQYAMVIVPVISVMTGLFVAGVSGSLTGSRAAAALSGSLFAVHPVVVWFGRLPTSEVGFGLLSTILAYQLIRASQGGRAWPVSLTVAAMVVSRPNGLVLVLPFTAIIVVAALSSSRWDHWARTIGPFVLGWISGFLWLANFDLFRSVVATFGGEFGVDTTSLSEQLSSPGWQAAIVIGMLLYWVVLSRLWAPGWTTDNLVPVLVGGTVVASFIVVVIAGRLFLLRDGLSSLGYATLILGLLGGIALLADRTVSMPGLTAVLAPATLWSLVYAFQFDETVPHYIYLYWERYLYPNVTLGVLVLAGGLAATIERVTTSDTARSTIALAALVPAAVVAVISVPQYQLQHHTAYHGDGFYDALQAIAADIPEGATVAYNGVPAELIWERYFFFFANTYRVIANPLRQTFEVSFTNLPGEPTAPDPLGGADQNPTHLLSVSLEPREELQPLTAGQHEFPISLLPRDSVEIADWDEWTVIVTVKEIQ